MKHPSTDDNNDDDDENLPSPPTIPTHQRASQSQLLTRIYYPDTLYPDSYSFFADRTEANSSKARLAPTTALAMDSNEQYPATMTSDPLGPTSNLSTISKQATTEIEIIDRQSKYPVSVTRFYLHSFHSLCVVFTRDFSNEKHCFQHWQSSMKCCCISMMFARINSSCDGEEGEKTLSRVLKHLRRILSQIYISLIFVVNGARRRRHVLRWYL